MKIEIPDVILLYLLAALPILSEHPITFMSDREKRLMDAEALLPLCICRAYCCFHLKENFTTKLFRTLADIFWQNARSPTAYLYNYHMNTLHQLNPTATAYIRNIPSQFWVAAFIPGRRYGQDTSNIVERINFDFKALRELLIAELLQTHWRKVMTVRYQPIRVLRTPS